MRIEYAEQPKPAGIAQAFVIGADFIGKSGVSLILGDNIFHGTLDFYRDALAMKSGACVFGYKVRDPERYGVVEFGPDGRAISIEEKPAQPKSPYAVPGLYVYDEKIVEIATNLKPSARGELEITDVNLEYMRRGELYVRMLGRGMAWLDTGTQESLLDASNYIAALQNRQGFKVACIEEIAFYKRFINATQMESLIAALPKNEYRQYLQDVLSENVTAPL